MVFACIVTLVVLILCCFIYLGGKRGHSQALLRIDEWASQNEFTIISVERRWFLRGAYTFNATLNQDVYLVQYKSSEGRPASCYICLGDCLLGRLSDRFAVWPSN
jgi:hypothetical protein